MPISSATERFDGSTVKLALTLRIDGLLFRCRRWGGGGGGCIIHLWYTFRKLGLFYYSTILSIPKWKTPY